MASTMAEVRSLFWIPGLRKITKSITQNCYGFKWSRATHYVNCKPGLLPRDRTEQALPSEILGTDYLGPLYYKSKGKKDLKAYILLFSCSVSRAIDLKLVSNFITTDFIKSFKRLMSRRGKPNNIYSQIKQNPLRQKKKWLDSIKRE